MIPRIDAKATGKNIKALMACTDTTKDEIRLWCDVSLQTYYDWTSGRRVPSTKNLLILSWLFECKMDDIIAVAYG